MFTRLNMKILRFINVFIVLRLVIGIDDVSEGILDVIRDTNVGRAYITDNIIKPNITMNNSVDRDNYDDTTDMNWDINLAIRDLAYYLRAHKFVDYDRRYYNKIEDVKHRLWEEFPKPPLKSLHWEVNKYCNDGFIKCVKYLDSIVQQTLLKRKDDTIVIKRNNKWTSSKNMLEIINVDRECKAIKERDNLTYVPFQGPIERFQWRTTASYYMCWYTMLGKRELKFFNEPCDDFADCMTIYGNNRDLRAQDRIAFACALYSFCPDPCCSMRITWNLDKCYRSPLNPCYKSNSTKVQKCRMNRRDNENFYGLIANQINITCECNEYGYEWSSRYGLCIDINECTRGLHNCYLNANEICINLPGTFACICLHGFIYSDETDGCVENFIFKKILLQSIKEHGNSTGSLNLLDSVVKFLTKSSANRIIYSTMLISFLLLFNIINS